MLNLLFLTNMTVSNLKTLMIIRTRTLECKGIGSVHLSENGTIVAFWGEKGESQLDEKGECL